MTCKADDCDGLVKIPKHGLCHKHYMRLYRNGDLNLRTYGSPKSRRPGVDIRCTAVSPDGLQCSLDLRHIAWPFETEHRNYLTEPVAYWTLNPT